MRVCIVLSEETLALLELPVNGNGGHQSLMRRIAKQRAGNLQYLSYEQVTSIRKKASGVGGFQKRWRALAAHFEAQLPSQDALEAQAASNEDTDTEVSLSLVASGPCASLVPLRHFGLEPSKWR